MVNVITLISKEFGTNEKMPLFFKELLEINFPEVRAGKKIPKYALHSKDQWYSAMLTIKTFPIIM